PGPAGDIPADQRRHHHVGAGRRLGERIECGEIGAGHPVMHVDHLAVHLGQDGVTAAEGDERELAEDDREPNHRLVHPAAFIMMKMLSGAITTMVGTMGRWKTAMATRTTSAMTMANGLRRSGRASLIAMATSKPAAAAARPANMCTTCGSLL